MLHRPSPSSPTCAPSRGHAHDLADRLGIGVSLTCAVHCALTGLLSVVPSLFSFGRVGASPLASLLESIEVPMLLLALGFGLYSLVPAYRNEHLDPTPLGLFLVGVAQLFVSRFVEGGLEIAVTVAGVSCIATAHLLNLRACTRVHARLAAAPDERP